MRTTCRFHSRQCLWQSERPRRAAPHGIDPPEDYKDWRVIAPSHRTESQTLRAVNDRVLAGASPLP